MTTGGVEGCENKVIPHSCPTISEDDIAALVECARSLQLKGGPAVQRLERQVAADTGYAAAVATTSCRHAIQLLLRALFPGGGALVGLPSFVCRSVHDAVALAGCCPRVLDIDPTSFSVSPQERRLASLDALIVPHMFGIRAPVEEFQRMGLLVIEDCAQRLTPFNSKAGKGQFRVLSFEATKLITCGEGGLLLADDEEIIRRVRYLRDAPYDFPHPALGLTLTDLQAALAATQWRRLPAMLARRREIARYYLESLADAAPPAMQLADTYHFRFLLWVDRPDKFMRSGSRDNVIFRRPVAPMCLHALFDSEGDFSVTEEVFSHLVSLPIYPRLTDEEASRVVAAAQRALVAVGSVSVQEEVGSG